MKRRTGPYKGMVKTADEQSAPKNSTVAASDGPKAGPSKAGNPKTGMGVKAGSSNSASFSQSQGNGAKAGLSRTNRGKNQTGSGSSQSTRG